MAVFVGSVRSNRELPPITDGRPYKCFDAYTLVFWKEDHKWVCVRTFARPWIHLTKGVVHKFRSEGWRTINLPKPHYDLVSLDEENTLPIYNLADLHHDSVPPHTRVCKIEDSFLCKARVDRRLLDWGRHLDEEYHLIRRLKDSPYVLPLHGLRVVVIDGFLVPFVGSHSGLFHDGEWTVYEKEILAVALIDALYDIESRGVSPSNVDANTVRLTLDGLKVVGGGLREVGRELVCYSPDWYSHAKAEILGALSAIICHLFTEYSPHCSYVDQHRMPTLFKDVVKHAMGMQTVAQLRQEMWEELQEIRERGVTVLDLVRKRHSRFERQALSKNTWWFGMNDQGVAWQPDFHRKGLRTRWI
ncbi:hypothetical protein IW261DRAFT_1555445 [Armillaria novae-zelandiae]|uniref:Uncharacterized protein n=1 Tax=Armillaria novae-zelandiae TaxID=153914 RepID=A0AA39UND7_9AGAR|nr:hypothetical protein IW261DRAFT_1555445 [Armillaria novae-zelandiae]